MRALIWIGIILSLPLSLRSAADDELRGKLTEKVVCVADASQSYALYVPSNYTTEKNWPVIYCFDPGARGRAPVERLKDAAEKFGYIVAGSNNSRNGSWEIAEAAIRAMTRDVASRFSTDRKRVYSAGLSGGARVAIQLAISGYSKGVIACSAGFYDPPGVPAEVPFPFFGTAGTEDFNHHEMKDSEDGLLERKAVHRVVIFPGGHEWAPVPVLTEALEWLDLQAMRSGARARDNERIQAAWQRRSAAVPRTPELDRWRELRSLAADFKGLLDTTEVENEAKKLGAKSEVKAAAKRERSLLARETALVEQLDNAASRSAAAKKKLAAEIRAKSEAPEDSDERRMIHRALAGYSSVVRESVRDLFLAHDYAQAAGVLEMAIELRPNQSRNWLDLARARAFAHEPARALDALRQAAALGLSGAERVESEPAFATLKSDAAFQEILARIRSNPPEAPEWGRDGGGRGRLGGR